MGTVATTGPPELETMAGRIICGPRMRPVPLVVVVIVVSPPAGNTLPCENRSLLFEIL